MQQSFAKARLSGPSQVLSELVKTFKEISEETDLETLHSGDPIFEQLLTSINEPTSYPMPDKLLGTKVKAKLSSHEPFLARVFSKNSRLLGPHQHPQ